MTDRSRTPLPTRPSWAATLVALLPVLSAPLLGVGLAWGQDQLTPEPGSGAPAASPAAAPAGPLVPPQPPPPVPLAQPLRPDPAALPSRPPARFDASLDALVRDGVVSPAERARIRSGSGMTPFNVPAHQQTCRSGALSQQECSSGLVVRWRERFNQGSGTDGSSGFSDSLVGVSCTTLMINRKPTYKPWGSWQRPGRGTPDEQLVIDRCANPNRLSTP